MLSLVLFVTGCANTNYFKTYPDQQRERLHALGADRLNSKISAKNSNSDLLSNLENGRIHQIHGDFSASSINFRTAIELFNKQNRQALIDTSSLGLAGASIVLNDTVRRYQGALFERIFLHLFQAQNYLFQGDLQAAAVEVRRMNIIDRELLSVTRKQRAKEQSNEAKYPQGSDGRFDKDRNVARLNDRLSEMTEQAKSVKHDYFNAYAYFISGLIYELNSSSNDAYIDYRKGLELAPSSTVLRNSMIRSGLKAGFGNELGVSKQLVRKAASKPGRAEIVVLHEYGLAPVMQEHSFPIQKYDGGFLSVSLPAYTDFIGYVPLLTVGVRPQAVSSEPRLESIFNLEPVVAKALQDRQGELLLRQSLRVLAKNRLQNEAADKGGPIFGIFASLYNVISERADLRSWLTLPNKVQVARFDIDPGEYTLQLSASRTNSRNLTVAASEGEIIIVRCITVGQQMYIQQVTF